MSVFAWPEAWIAMRTQAHREAHRQACGAFPSSLTDAERVMFGPLIPDPSPVGRPRKPDMRAAMSALLHLLRTGCSWRYLPRNSFTPRSTVA